MPRTHKTAAIALSAAIALGAGALTASAAPRGDGDSLDERNRSVDSRITKSRNRLAEYSSDLDKANRRYVRAKDAYDAAVRAESAAMDRREEALQAEREAREDLDVANAEVAINKKRMKKAAYRRNKARGGLVQAAADAYMDTTGDIAQLNETSQALDDPQAAMDMQMAREAIGDVKSDKLDDLRSAESQLVSLEDELTAARDKQARAVAAKKSARDDAERALNDAQAARDEQASSLRDRSEAKKDLGDQVLKEKEHLEALDVENQKLGEELRARAEARRLEREKAEARRRAQSKARSEDARPSREVPSQDVQGPAGGGEGFTVPENAPVTSEFGMRFHPILRYWRLHGGMDFGGSCGAPVYAMASGTVVSAGDAGGYGNRVVIDHGWKRGVNLASSYNHLQSISVSGGEVRQGQVIGYEGSTGLSTGCHLHFETWENGVQKNPRRWINP